MIGTQQFFETDSPPKILPATDDRILQYLRRSYQVAEISISAEREDFILETCDRLNIQVTDEEWQAAGDAFRFRYKLLGVPETQKWLTQQRITIDDWSQGIKIQLLTKKLKEYLFGIAVDGQYLQDRERFRRVALSQIVVTDLTEATNIAKVLREEKASFCALALEHSKGKQSHQYGGFIGVRFLVELLPEIAKAISEIKEGDIVGPIQTKLGYHILKVEKWYQLHLNEQLREQLIETLFQNWLREQLNLDHQ
jgi:parvulin-like peptidyl-prolyl isomerase